MEEKILRKMTIKSLLLLGVVLTIIIILQQKKEVTTINSNINDKAFSVLSESNKRTLHNISYHILLGWEETTVIKNVAVKNVIGNNYIKVRKTENDKIKIYLEDLYMSQSIRLVLNGLSRNNISLNDVISSKDGKEVNGGELLKNSFIQTEQDLVFGLDDTLRGVQISYAYDVQNLKYKAIIDMKFDHVYVHKLYEDDEYIYIDLLNPNDVYETILVVDAGHGGLDAGTYSTDLKYLEKDFNLDIVLRLKEYLDKENIKVYYTRLVDEKIYLKPRVALANDLNADLFISIHCNALEGDTTANGTEVLYNQSHSSEKLDSKRLAEICLDELVTEIGTRKRGIIKGEDKYIVGHSNVPVALIEVVFLTNQGDLEFLLKDENREKVAKGVLNGINKALQVLEEKK